MLSAGGGGTCRAAWGHILHGPNSSPELPQGQVVCADVSWSVPKSACACIVFKNTGEKLKCKIVCTYLHRHTSIMCVCVYTHSFASQLLSCVPKSYLIFKSVYTHCASASLNMNIL